MNKSSHIIKLLLVSSLVFSLNSCGAKKLFKKVDAQKTPINAIDRAKNRIQNKKKFEVISVFSEKDLLKIKKVLLKNVIK